MSETRIEEASTELTPWLLSINEANTPKVGSLDLAAIDALLPMQFAVRLVRFDGEPAGAMFLMRPGQAYRSANYLWFCDRFDEFLYVDRVMIDQRFRGRGLGRLLYQNAEALAASHSLPRIACEINTEPPNPGSLAFHQRLGFRPIVERPSDGGKTVMMMEKPLV